MPPSGWGGGEFNQRSKEAKLPFRTAVDIYHGSDAPGRPAADPNHACYGISHSYSIAISATESDLRRFVSSPAAGFTAFALLSSVVYVSFPFT